MRLFVNVKCHRRFDLFDLNVCSLKWLILTKKTKKISFSHVIKIYKSKFLDNLQFIFFTHFCFQHMTTSSLQSIVILHHWLHCDNHHTKYFVDLVCLFLFYQNSRAFAILLLDDFFISSFSIDFSSMIIVWIFLSVCFSIFFSHLIILTRKTISNIFH